jgi:hypothetical protein
MLITAWLAMVEQTPGGAACFRKCLHLYHYWMDAEMGLMSARIQSWFPFSIQVCINGREWLARQMDTAGWKYVQQGNCFVWLEDYQQAQALLGRQLETNWAEWLDGVAQVNPARRNLSAYPGSYWSVYRVNGPPIWSSATGELLAHYAV